MKQKEELLSNELGEVHKKLEICLQNQIKGLESFVGHSKFDEVLAKGILRTYSINKFLLHKLFSL